MLRSILIGLDGSSHSLAAIGLGIRWAKRYDALLVGLGVVDEPAICRLEPVVVGGSHYREESHQYRLHDARRKIERFLEQFVCQCHREGVGCDIMEDVGSPYEQILRESKRHDLLLLGQQTYFHFETQDWPDETLRRVLRQSSRPVVTVPDNLTDGTSVVIAYDGSPQADRALQSFRSLGLAEEGEVHVVSIDADSKIAECLANLGTRFLERHGIHATAHDVRSGGATGETILALAKQLDARLLVMGAYGKSMWREFVFGSTTSQVVEACRAPLFLCR